MQHPHQFNSTIELPSLWVHGCKWKDSQRRTLGNTRIEKLSRPIKANGSHWSGYKRREGLWTSQPDGVLLYV